MTVWGWRWYDDNDDTHNANGNVDVSLDDDDDDNDKDHDDDVYRGTGPSLIVNTPWRQKQSVAYSKVLTKRTPP